MTDYRMTFDGVADLYDEARPTYPEALIEEIMRLAALNSASEIVEVGVGTGQITLPFAKRGVSVLGLELGSKLAAFSKRKFEGFPRVSILNSSFEDWQPEIPFDLFLSAQAFHWVESEFGLAKAARVLKPSGCIALVWHLDRSYETDFYKASTPLFERFVTASGDPNRPKLVAAHERYKEALEDSELFAAPLEWSVSWEFPYTKEAYIKLLSTFSDNLVLESSVRNAFYFEMSELIDSFGGTITRYYETVLIFAEKQAL